MTKLTVKQIRDNIDALYGHIEDEVKLRELTLMAAIEMINLGTDNIEVVTPIGKIELIYTEGE